MAASLSLQILTPGGPLSLGEGDGMAAAAVPGVELPSATGELGILPDHIPLVTAVVPGLVRCVVGGAPLRLAVGRGFAELSDDGRLTLLVERAVRADELDKPAVTAALAAAKAALASSKAAADSPDHRALVDEIAWCEAQLRLAVH